MAGSLAQIVDPDPLHHDLVDADLRHLESGHRLAVVPVQEVQVRGCGLGLGLEVPVGGGLLRVVPCGLALVDDQLTGGAFEQLLEVEQRAARPTSKLCQNFVEF